VIKYHPKSFTVGYNGSQQQTKRQEKPTVFPNHSKIPEQKIFYGTAGIINPRHKRKLKHKKHHVIKTKTDY